MDMELAAQAYAEGVSMTAVEKLVKLLDPKNGVRVPYEVREAGLAVLEEREREKADSFLAVSNLYRGECLHYWRRDLSDACPTCSAEAERDELRRVVAGEVGWHLDSRCPAEAKVKELEAERDRLREALLEVRGYLPASDTAYYQRSPSLKAAIMKADAALRAPEGGKP